MGVEKRHLFWNRANLFGKNWLVVKLYLSHSMKKSTKWPVRPGKTQISLSGQRRLIRLCGCPGWIRLGGCASWSESSMGAQVILVVFTCWDSFCCPFQMKVEQNSTPSKVCHLRSLPNDVTDSEVVQLGIPFGRMSNVLLLKQKSQVQNHLVLSG